jgi:hypothetical protein
MGAAGLNGGERQDKKVGEASLDGGEQQVMMTASGRKMLCRGQQIMKMGRCRKKCYGPAGQVVMIGSSRSG